MQRINYNNNTNNENPAITFVKNNWLFILGIMVVFPYLKAWFEKMAIKSKVDDVKNDMSLNSQINALDNPKLQESEADKILKNFPIAQRERLKADVKLFTHHIGINYNWYDPKSWSENDKEAVNILKKWVLLLPVFANLYYSVYTQSRNLKTDFNKMIDEKEKQNMYAFQKQHNVKFF
jgi:hypothetical protein